MPTEGECTSYNRALFCLLGTENVPADRDFAERGRMYQLHSGRKRETAPTTIGLPTTHNLVEEGECTTTIDVRRGEQNQRIGQHTTTTGLSTTR